MEPVENTTDQPVIVQAPFPWFGGKRRVAHLMWPRLGNPRHYIEPFAGSLAMLLNRPHAPQVETVNDADGYLCNFWRAVQWDPDAVAAHAEWPVNEMDLHARHQWLVSGGAERLRRLREDPRYFDAEIAGWWVWGVCQWIGGGWCHGVDWEGDTPSTTPWRIKPALSSAGMGVHALPAKRPMLGKPGRGVHAEGQRTEGLIARFRALSERLRRVRVCCGDFARVLTPAVITGMRPTAVFLDPPYAPELRRKDVYGTDSADVATRARAWALENGQDPDLRIALCGYAGEHAMPDDWECVAWTSTGGYGNRSAARGRENRAKERIWFSPTCARPGEAAGLFGEEGA